MIDLLVLGVFIAFAIVSWYFRISYRVSMTAGLMFLVVAALVAGSGAEDAGNFIAVLAYFSLVVGVSLAIAQHVSERREIGNIVVAKNTKAALIIPRPSLALARLLRFIRRMRRAN